MLHIWECGGGLIFCATTTFVLMEQIDTMSWRFFLVLLNNLSPTGAVAVRIRAEAEKEKNNTDEKTDEQAANAFFSSIVSV